MNVLIDIVAPLSALALTSAVSVAVALYLYGAVDRLGFNRFERFVMRMPAVEDVLTSCFKSDYGYDARQSWDIPHHWRAQERLWLDYDNWQEIKNVHRHGSIGVRWAVRAGFLEVRDDLNAIRHDPFVRMTPKGLRAFSNRNLLGTMDSIPVYGVKTI